MKSILWVLNGCGLEGRGITGAPVRFHEISRRFAREGVRQHVLTTSGGKTMIETLGSELPTTVVPASLFLTREPCVPFRFWSYVVTSLSWRRALRELPSFDTVITVSDYFCDVIPARALKRRTGARWIAWIHHCETEPQLRPGNRLVNELTYRMQRWSFSRIAAEADAAWINDTIAGDEIERRLTSVGMDTVRIRRMKNGIDGAAIVAAPEPQEKKYDAVMVGVRPNKGLHDILPIWERVLRRRPGTSLLLMGGMSGEGAVAEEIRRRGLPITVFKPTGGFLPAAEYYAKLKSARILFAPSHEEGWGIAVCEAMAAGLPVVAYDLPAYRKIYAGAYAVIPCFDFDAFSERIVEILDDASAQARLKAVGDRTSAAYSWDSIASSDFAAIGTP